MAKQANKYEGERTSKKRKHANVVIHQNDQKGDTNRDIEAEPETSRVHHSSKRRRSEKPPAIREEPDECAVNEELETSKPSAVFKPKKGRDWTLSLALPGSFIANSFTLESKTDLAGRIARAAAVFCVDEIVIFDDSPVEPNKYLKEVYYAKEHSRKSKAELLSLVEPVDEPWRNPDQFLFHVLSFLECPSHLRKHLFDEHQNLSLAGKLPTLDMPHHMKDREWCQYREGVTLDPEKDEIPGQHRRRSDKLPLMDAEESALVDCGFPHPIKLDQQIPPGLRVTLKFARADPPPSWPHISAKHLADLDVEPTVASTPREEAGYYWGYTTRRAESLSAVFTESPFEDGYDVSIGTSERGVPLSSILPGSSSASNRKSSSKSSSRSADIPSDAAPATLPPSFQHLLLVFGGVTGLEPAVAADPVLQSKGLTKETAHEVFDYWVNLLPGQGSRTIRLEEAVWIGLMGLREYVVDRDAE